MSAECQKHGCDLTYPAGSWPVGECPECVADDRITVLVEALHGLVLVVEATRGRNRIEADELRRASRRARAALGEGFKEAA